MSESVGLQWCLRICISNKVLGDIDVASGGAIHGEPIAGTQSSEKCDSVLKVGLGSAVSNRRYNVTVAETN